ncbi:ferritin-like domain-containing protein [Sphingomonas sp. GlSt437]|uniref:ferritin-like domain-containing protein n=1 Tax=Sphingomonas sp. GlSt437 TaxID=3389970 RepID=UPI003A89722F
MSDLKTGRREFLGHAGLVTASLVAIGTAGSAVDAAVRGKAAMATAGGDIDILQTALALEHEGIAAYTIAAGSGLLTPDVIKVASVFLGHHQQHRDRLAGLIRTAGGHPVDPKTDAEYTQELNLGALKSQGDVLALATKLEQGASSAYVGQAAGLKDHQLAGLFASLAADEASHWAVLNNAIGGAVPTKGFIFG